MRKFNCVQSGKSEKKFGRVLSWKLNFGSIDLLCHFQKTYEVNMQGFHMAILMLFNDQNEITYEQIKSQTEI